MTVNLLGSIQGGGFELVTDSHVTSAITLDLAFDHSCKVD